MKDTIRLKQSVKAGLEATGYHDANEAIASLLQNVTSPVTNCNKDMDTLMKTVAVQKETIASLMSSLSKIDERGNHDEAYWARFRDEVREAMKAPVILRTYPGLVPASTLKTIGKIEPGERLEEPVGRQGRFI